MQERATDSVTRDIKRAAVWLALSVGLAGLGLAAGIVQRTWPLVPAGVGAALLLLFCIRERHANLKLRASYRAAVDAQREFVAAVSHDLRTPLTAIFGFSQLLTEENSLSPERQKTYMEMIREQSALLARMIEDTVDLARIVDGSLSVRFGECDAGEMAGESLLLYLPPEERGRLQLSVAEATPLLWVDRFECEQVCDRVLSAALAHSAASAGDPAVVTVGCRRGMVQFTVQAPELNLESETFLPLRGTLGAALLLGRGDPRCLGLAAARGLVEMQGGAMWLVEGTSDAETAICFSLPAVRKAPAPAETPAPPRLITAPEPN